MTRHASPVPGVGGGSGWSRREAWPRPQQRTYRREFLLDPEIAFLNHGSFGACPRPVFERYRTWQRELEREPIDFLDRRLPGLLDDARSSLAAYLGCPPTELAFVPNATTGVNLAARSLGLGPGDEVLATDLEYGACDLTPISPMPSSAGIASRSRSAAPRTTSSASPSPPTPRARRSTGC